LEALGAGVLFSPEGFPGRLLRKTGILQPGSLFGNAFPPSRGRHGKLLRRPVFSGHGPLQGPIRRPRQEARMVPSTEGGTLMRRMSIPTGALVAAALIVFSLAVLVVFQPCPLAQDQPAKDQAKQEQAADEVAAVKAVIESAYIKGIHIDRDVEAIRKGFHPAFTMFVYKDGDVSKMTIDEWISGIEEGKKKNPNPPKVETKHEFSMVEVSGNAAVARVELHKNGKHVFTDFMSLYKFPDGWKIVGKIYYRHP
jgi:hypothetical protein